MASEDSDEVVPGFLPIHRLHDLDDVGKTSTREVMTNRHHLDARSELLEVEPFRRAQRVRTEERDDTVEQLLSRVHGVEMHVLPVVVRPPVDVHLSHSEELTQLVEARSAGGALHDHEVV
jgi:hypothetical protein